MTDNEAGRQNDLTIVRHFYSIQAAEKDLCSIHAQLVGRFEDVGEEMAAHVVDFMQRNPIPEAGPRFRVRYCEMILPYPEGGGVTASVYGTQQLNDCPQEAWEAIDPEAVAEEYGSLAALQNGPRYWVLDDIEIGEGGFTGDPLPGRGEIFFFGQLIKRIRPN